MPPNPQDPESSMSPLPIAVLVVLLAQGPSPVLRSPPAAAERDFERLLLAIPDSASLRAMSRDLTRLPHMAGTPAQAVTRDYVVEKLRSWGLESWTKEYTVYLPQARDRGGVAHRPSGGGRRAAGAARATGGRQPRDAGAA